MRLSLYYSLFLLILAPIVALSEIKVARFDNASTDINWSLKELAADLPSDWSGYSYLTLELRSSTAQRFELRIVTTNGVRRVGLLPFQNTWIRAAIPLAYFEKSDRQGSDLASLGNKSRVAYWINLLGEHGPLNATFKALASPCTIRSSAPVVEIPFGPIGRKESPGDAAILEAQPLVDEFGQWIQTDWPGKAKSLDDLKQAWAEEEKTLKPGGFDFCQFGGYKQTKARATGFFRVEKIDDRWWFVDPDGHLFFSTGADVTTSWVGTRTEGRNGVFTSLPPRNLRAPTSRSNQASLASFYTWNLTRRFGTNYSEPWVDLTMRRMEAWGFNTIANWSDARLWDAKRKPYVVILHGWDTDTGSYMGMPDVFSDDFQRKRMLPPTSNARHAKTDPRLVELFRGQRAAVARTGG